ncbi:MAP/microtubule affinity-regulating kinase 3 [Geranomyces michiganensis]|nr:MAP/microtubule affinity-regulating kinase 3 [Geranomyces michiganensis]
MAQTQPRILDSLNTRRERESREQRRPSASQQRGRSLASGAGSGPDVGPSPAPVKQPSTSSHQSSIGNYDYVRTIGEGSFAKVKLAVHRLTDEKVAIKVIDKDSLPDTYSFTHLHREAQIMRMLDHPNIVQLIEVMETKRELHLVLEYASGGEVLDYIVAHQRLKEPEARKFFHEVVSALKYCHERNIVHRDLKAENLLLDSDMHIKISGMELGKELDHANHFGLSNIFDRRKQLTTCCGSPVYSAPELIEGRKYVGPEIDSWSLGVNLFAMVVGDLPFAEKDLKKLYERILSGKYQVPNYVSAECRDLISKLLVLNPARRYTSAQVLEHPWMQSVSQSPSQAWEENGASTVDGANSSGMPAYVRPQKVPELDMEILQHMITLNYDLEVAKQDILGGKFNQAAGTYYLLALKKRRETAWKIGAGASNPSGEDARQKAQKVPRPAVDDVTSDELALILIKAERTRVTNRMQEEQGGHKQVRNRKELVPGTGHIDEVGGQQQQQQQQMQRARSRIRRPSTHQEPGGAHPIRLQKESRESQHESAEIARDDNYQPPPAMFSRGRRHSLGGPGEMYTPTAMPAESKASAGSGGGGNGQAPSHGRSVSIDTTTSSAANARIPPLRHIIRAAQQGNNGLPTTLPPIPADPANHHHAPAPHLPASKHAQPQPQPQTSRGIPPSSSSSTFSAAAPAAGGAAGALASPAPAPAPATNSYLRSHRPRSNTLQIDESLYMPSVPDATNMRGGLLDDGGGGEPRTIRFAFNCSTTTPLPCDVLYTRLIDTLRGAGFTYVAEGFLCLCETGDIRLEAEICKLPRLQMHGIRFKRISGDMWKYKENCQRIMDGLGL